MHANNGNSSNISHEHYASSHQPQYDRGGSPLFQAYRHKHTIVNVYLVMHPRGVRVRSQFIRVASATLLFIQKSIMITHHHTSEERRAARRCEAILRGLAQDLGQWPLQNIIAELETYSYSYIFSTIAWRDITPTPSWVGRDV